MVQGEGLGRQVRTSEPDCAAAELHVHAESLCTLGARHIVLHCSDVGCLDLSGHGGGDGVMGCGGVAVGEGAPHNRWRKKSVKRSENVESF